MQNNLAEKINAILPQTQCGKCEFSGCAPYAKAISEGKADINQCPPGGKNGILKIYGRMAGRGSCRKYKMDKEFSFSKN